MSDQHTKQVIYVVDTVLAAESTGWERCNTRLPSQQFNYHNLPYIYIRIIFRIPTPYPPGARTVLPPIYSILCLCIPYLCMRRHEKKKKRKKGDSHRVNNNKHNMEHHTYNPINKSTPITIVTDKQDWRSISFNRREKKRLL